MVNESLRLYGVNLLTKKIYSSHIRLIDIEIEALSVCADWRLWPQVTTVWNIVEYLHIYVNFEGRYLYEIFRRDYFRLLEEEWTDDISFWKIITVWHITIPLHDKNKRIRHKQRLLSQTVCENKHAPIVLRILYRNQYLGIVEERNI